MRRIKRVGRLSAAILGLSTTIVLAYFAGTFIAEGTFTGETGKGGSSHVQTEAITTSFPAGLLTPTNSVPLTATINNTSGKTLTFTHLEYHFASSVKACNEEASVFSLLSEDKTTNEMMKGVTKTLTVAPGEQSLGASDYVVMSETTTAGEESCENAPITLEIKLH